MTIEILSLEQQTCLEDTVVDENLPESEAMKRTSKDPSLHSRQRRVLLAEDNADLRRLLSLHLCEADLEVVECAHGMELLDHLTSVVLNEEQDFDLIISDIRMPGVSGLSILEGNSIWNSAPPMILITAFGDEKTHARAAEFGAKAVLDKPFVLEEFLEVVLRVLNQKT